MSTRKRIYFDTNAILDMSQEARQALCGISPKQVRRLKRLIALGELTAVASMYNIEELLGPLERPGSHVSLGLVREDLGFLVGIVGRNGFIEQPRDVLDGDIRRCLAGERLEEHFLSGDDIWDGVQWVLNLRRGDDPTVVSLLAQSRSQIREFRELWDGIQSDFTRRWAEQNGADKAEIPTEEEVWHIAARHLVRDWAARRAGAGVDDSQVDALLHVKSMRLATGHLASFMYDLFFVEGRRVRETDSRDHMHVISASVADVFVTGDDRLTRILDRIPDRGIDVMPLSDFLAQL